MCGNIRRTAARDRYGLVNRKLAPRQRTRQAGAATDRPRRAVIAP